MRDRTTKTILWEKEVYKDIKKIVGEENYKKMLRELGGKHGINFFSPSLNFVFEKKGTGKKSEIELNKIKVDCEREK